jgi:hypothetical protein
MTLTTVTTAKIDSEVCAEALKFTKLFNDSADRRRELAPNFYSTNEPTLIWNGNLYSGVEEIKAHWSKLPSTQHEYSFKVHCKSYLSNYITGFHAWMLTGLFSPTLKTIFLVLG